MWSRRKSCCRNNLSIRGGMEYDTRLSPEAPAGLTGGSSWAYWCLQLGLLVSRGGAGCLQKCVSPRAHSIPGPSSISSPRMRCGDVTDRRAFAGAVGS